ncbi:hypothetical protein RJ45_14605 [Photobacterium gaetbulicola]|uniref:Copper resistance protein n=1 Tax=Photobacterium gaetbulicola TaxID=1295392 RepID=A0A0B9G2P6_9GAMM|nr:hypothetical protein [Photobacterium gaetbulicola]KHT62944.1 hypothetical protein RJ45_14605 [Photobacterium gaetbulicola]
MRKTVNQSQTAKFTLLLVLVVIVVCSGQNFGYAATCELRASSSDATDQATFSDSVTTKAGASSVSDQCSMADHLLQMHKHSVEHAIVSLFIFILAVLSYAAITKAILVFTEPIPPARRRHLTLCVFRE